MSELTVLKCDDCKCEVTLETPDLQEGLIALVQEYKHCKYCGSVFMLCFHSQTIEYRRGTSRSWQTGKTSGALVDFRV